MDAEQVLTAYDAQVRRGSGGNVSHERECTAHVVRSVSSAWRGIIWCGLEEACADEVIAGEIARFAGAGDWEWKYYSHDRPADLPQRLLDAGFTREDDEALLFAEISELPLAPAPPEGVELRAVEDEGDLAGMVAVHDAVFGGDNTSYADDFLTALRAGDPVSAVVAWAGSQAVGAGRLELNPGTEFASLWGGAVLRQWRHRGIFRAMVAHRTALAAAAGYRYMHLDSTPDSQPIMRALGFVQAGITAPFRHPGTPLSAG